MSSGQTFEAKIDQILASAFAKMRRQIIKEMKSVARLQAQAQTETRKTYKFDPSILVGIDTLALSNRAENCLKVAGLYTVNEIINMTDEELSQFPNMGKKTVAEIRARIDALFPQSYD
jgi:DNA-directed RNA polymerase alpha subunit